MVVKATCWLWPVSRPRNRIDSAEAASESIAAPLRTSLPPSSRRRFGRTSRQRREFPRTVTSAHRTDVDPLDTDAMRKGSHPPWRYSTTLLACRSVASAGRRELRPIYRGVRCLPGERTLGGAAGSGPEPAGRTKQDQGHGCEKSDRHDNEGGAVEGEGEILLAAVVEQMQRDGRFHERDQDGHDAEQVH
jgi:hypothetical protein